MATEERNVSEDFDPGPPPGPVLEIRLTDDQVNQFHRQRLACRSFTRLSVRASHCAVISAHSSASNTCHASSIGPSDSMGSPAPFAV